ncbi:uncharacterized protein B0H64DRAFT_207742 [Chaetomium fimeti]|uniref:Uncharacterized protein n=1 Tax=Chaetomium fimeti TaxID=1854472 RepID=A0AAE0HAY5_9PEZI|nr:hypothetical protein B0H64DRAFT_207742 [Chaetomium fimeti]
MPRVASGRGTTPSWTELDNSANPARPGLNSPDPTGNRETAFADHARCRPATQGSELLSCSSPSQVLPSPRKKHVDGRARMPICQRPESVPCSLGSEMNPPLPVTPLRRRKEASMLSVPSSSRQDQRRLRPMVRLLVEHHAVPPVMAKLPRYWLEGWGISGAHDTCSVLAGPPLRKANFRRRLHGMVSAFLANPGFTARMMSPLVVGSMKLRGSLMQWGTPHGCFGADRRRRQLNGWPIAADPAESPPDAALVVGWRGTQPRHHCHPPSPEPRGDANESWDFENAFPFSPVPSFSFVFLA